jgi:hypothetical protein
VDRFISYYGTVYTAGIDLTSATAKTGSEPMIAVGDGHFIKSGTTVPSYFATKVITNTDADATVSALDLGSTFTKDNSNTRAFSVARIKPTLNFGSVTPNANTTVNVLHVDTTNTATTGATVNLAKLAYGGADRFVVLSTAEINHRATDGVSTAYVWDNHANSLTANTTINNLIARQSAGTFTTPLRTQAGQVAFRVSASGYTAADDSTTAAMVSAHRAALDFVTGTNDWTTSDVCPLPHDGGGHDDHGGTRLRHGSGHLDWRDAGEPERDSAHGGAQHFRWRSALWHVDERRHDLQHGRRTARQRLTGPRSPHHAPHWPHTRCPWGLPALTQRTRHARSH